MNPEHMVDYIGIKFKKDNEARIED